MPSSLATGKGAISLQHPQLWGMVSVAHSCCLCCGVCNRRSRVHACIILVYVYLHTSVPSNFGVLFTTLYLLHAHPTQGSV